MWKRPGFLISNHIIYSIVFFACQSFLATNTMILEDAITTQFTMHINSSVSYKFVRGFPREFLEMFSSVIVEGTTMLRKWWFLIEMKL